MICNNLEYCENKRIATRFLKEMGLYNAWKKYIKSNEYYKLNWYKVPKEKIYAIFGRTSFTYYLRKNYGIHFGSKLCCITDMFKQYVSETTDIETQRNNGVANIYVSPDVFKVDKLSKTITVNYGKD